MRENLDVTIEVPGHEPIHSTTEGIKRAANRAEQRSARANRRMAEGVQDAADLSQEMADAGLISQENAAETAHIADTLKDRASDKLNHNAMKHTRDQLRAIVERIERLDEERKTISDDIRDVYAEAKGNGFDVKALRTVVRMRKQDASERAEQETILETYMLALGMI